MPSKIYALCYLEPQSGYRLGQIIYSVEKYPPTSKIYGWTGKLVGKGYLQRNNEVFVSSARPLTEEIRNQLMSRNINIDDFEFKMLLDVLESNTTRQFMNNVINKSWIQNDGLSFLFYVINTLITTADDILDSREQLGTEDPKSVYDKKSTLSTKTKPRYPDKSSYYAKNVNYYEFFKKMKHALDKEELDFNKKISLSFSGIEKYWEIIQMRYEQTLSQMRLHIEKFGMKNFDEKDFTMKFRDSALFSLYLWLLPNKLLSDFRVYHWQVTAFTPSSLRTNK